MTTEDWVSAALKDDELVVKLLLRLKQHSSHPYASVRLKPPPVGWGHRQPRSKPATRKEVDPTCSPTTPLSWSGGGAGSPSDESCPRSKGYFTNETSTPTTNKRSRRKKSFAELKEEESLLFKERTHLRKEIAMLCVALEKQKMRSENLKRIKLDLLHLQSANKPGATLDKPPQEEISSQPNPMEAFTLEHVPMLPTHAKHEDLLEPKTFKVHKDAETQKRCLIIPDLNMMPLENHGRGTLSRMSCEETV
ncbi:hypothetical protein F0562_007406 [Nyssa sinensis]|uniref:Uncharacterized protein n=1 Tax=Nyssa sinensis TaxID=561372 RepID=A0A5J5A7Z2_9ASTE|nr:hypothetical protein F0562_007406 [Nyssa sinensis]